MKKLFITILLVLYLIPAVGITISAHFCSNELVFFSHFYKENRAHFCGKDNTKKNCCDDKQLSFKLKDIQQKTETLSQKFITPFLLQLLSGSFFESVYFFLNNREVNHYLLHPPDIFKVSLYILHQVFRI